MAEPETYGLLTVEREKAHRRKTGVQLHIYLDGVDVTTRCVAADDEGGIGSPYVVLYCRDRENHDWKVDNGELHLASGWIVHRLRIEGSVAIRPGPAIP